MRLFDLFKKKEEPTNIWEIKDKDEFVTELWGIMEEKCDYGEKMQALNEQERIFYVAQALEMEVNNGGFSQFFYNDSGNFANEIVTAFQEIFAYHTAEICQKAVNAFGGEVPIDRDEREELMDELLLFPIAHTPKTHCLPKKPHLLEAQSYPNANIPQR